MPKISSLGGIRLMKFQAKRMTVENFRAIFVAVSSVGHGDDGNGLAPASRSQVRSVEQHNHPSREEQDTET